VLTLPADLLRHEILLSREPGAGSREPGAGSREPVRDGTLAEIVDDVFLPLVGTAGTPKARTFGGDGTGP
jgi:hypothetical protein